MRLERLSVCVGVAAGCSNRLTWPESDGLDSGPGGCCTPVVRWTIRRRAASSITVPRGRALTRGWSPPAALSVTSPDLQVNGSSITSVCPACGRSPTELFRGRGGGACCQNGSLMTSQKTAGLKSEVSFYA